MVIIDEWKPTLDRKVIYEVQKPFEVEYGPVGPQINKATDGSYSYLPAGGEQVKLLYKDYKNTVANADNNFTKDAYMKVVSNTKLPKVKKIMKKIKILKKSISLYVGLDWIKFEIPYITQAILS